MTPAYRRLSPVCLPGSVRPGCDRSMDEIGVGVEFLVPPDKQKKATQTVLEQAQLLALDWAA